MAIVLFFPESKHGWFDRPEVATDQFKRNHGLNIHCRSSVLKVSEIMLLNGAGNTIPGAATAETLYLREAQNDLIYILLEVKGMLFRKPLQLRQSPLIQGIAEDSPNQLEDRIEHLHSPFNKLALHDLRFLAGATYDQLTCESGETPFRDVVSQARDARRMEAAEESIIPNEFLSRAQEQRSELTGPQRVS